MKRILNLFPPYFGAGIKVEHIDQDWMTIRVSMKLRWYNRNAVGVQFGGSLYSMVDPHLMLMLMGKLGPEYIIWDSAASIKFLRPGKGLVQTEIKLQETDLETIRERVSAKAPYFHEFKITIRDTKNKAIAEVSKTLYIKKK